MTKVDEALSLLSEWARAALGKDSVVDEMLVSLAAIRREKYEIARCLCVIESLKRCLTQMPMPVDPVDEAELRNKVGRLIIGVSAEHDQHLTDEKRGQIEYLVLRYKGRQNIAYKNDVLYLSGTPHLVLDWEVHEWGERPGTLVPLDANYVRRLDDGPNGERRYSYDSPNPPEHPGPWPEADRAEGTS